MNIHSLVGMTFDSCCFSKSSYAFEFSGSSDGVYRRFLVSTSFSVSAREPFIEDSGRNISSEIWDFLENELDSINLAEDESGFRIFFNFSGGGRFVVWSEGAPSDNLLVVKCLISGDWFTVF